MSRNRGLAILQKTYDDSYLKCSTAVYYESQGNEDDALRCWRNALGEIVDHHASKVLSNSTPQSATEKALIDSLRELELQCKERIDLLQALRVSRQDNGILPSFASSARMPAESGDPSGPLSSIADQGWIGQGTVPAITYPELSRPVLPTRPPVANRPSAENTTLRSSPCPTATGLDPGTSALPPASQSASMAPTRKDDPFRSPSPDKHTMRTTLRTRRTADKTGKLTRKPARPEEPGASKAATLAWSTLSSKDGPLRGPGSADSSRGSPQTSFDSGTKKADSASALQWDTHTRRLVSLRDTQALSIDSVIPTRHSDEYPYARPSTLSVNAASSALRSSTHELSSLDPAMSKPMQGGRMRPPHLVPAARMDGRRDPSFSPSDDAYEPRNGTPPGPLRRKAVRTDVGLNKKAMAAGGGRRSGSERTSHHRQSVQSEGSDSSPDAAIPPSAAKSAIKNPKGKHKEVIGVEHNQEGPPVEELGNDSESENESDAQSAWKRRKRAVLKSLPLGVDEAAAKQILNEIIVQGDEVHWGDVAGLEIAKNALRETVVYPFLRPDLFMGLREPARGMLLFGPPGTGKTMLARAVATESQSTFFSISASSLTSKYLGESEKLVRALFALAKQLAPSIIFVDEIDSLLSQRSGTGEHEATRRIKTEFLIQWSDLQRAAAGRAVDDRSKDKGDPNRVLVLAATNLPWAIDEAARRRFVRRQYIPLPESETRSSHIRTLLGQQKHILSNGDIDRLVQLTDGFSGSDITALAKDAAMGPLRSLGEALLRMTMDQIRPINLTDFESSLATIRPSVSKSGLKEYEDWAKEFGERGG